MEASLGLLKCPEGYVILSSFPILNSKGKGTPAGTLVIGRFLDDSQLVKLSQITNIQAHIFTLPLKPKDTDMQTAFSYLTQNTTPYYVAVANLDSIFGYTFIRDVNNKPIGILRINQNRDFYNEGMQTINRYLIIIISIGIIFLISLWYLLKIFILDRLISVSDQLIRINEESKFSTRLKVSGHDELSHMVDAINSLMEIIELTQEQLKYRIFLRTEELEHLSQSNKTLYSEMTRQKEIEASLRQDESLLRQMAYYDSLTGLPNRLYFNEMLLKIINNAIRQGGNFAVLYLDADKFKNINDVYGHDVGDKFLKHAAQQLRSSIKDTDIAARMAGDEFIICLCDIKDKDLIDSICKKILTSTALPLTINNAAVSSSFSIGISLYPQDGTTIEELEKHADLAMYYAKKRKSNAYYYYSDIENITPVT